MTFWDLDMLRRWCLLTGWIYTDDIARKANNALADDTCPVQRRTKYYKIAATEAVWKDAVGPAILED
jgi:hypothetical protein